MANMGGTWLSIVYGFGGVRIKENGLFLNPSIPEQWGRYLFRLTYQNRKLQVEVARHAFKVTLLEGDALDIHIGGRTETLKPGRTVTRPISGL